MFLNLTPYLTWIGIMLTSKPNDLQNRLNILSRPPVLATTAPTPPPTTVTTVRTTVTTKNPLDLFICTGRPIGRYAHTMDCRKYYACTGLTQFVRPTVCPNNLHFSPTVLLCTLPQDSGCTVVTTATTRRGAGVTPVTLATTPIPLGSNWLRQVEAANYYRALNENRLVIYYDHGVTGPQNILWPMAFTRVLWDNVISVYGNFGTDSRLYLVLRGQPLSEDLNYSSYLDSNRGFVNAIEVGSSDWSVENATNTDLIARNLAQIVSRNARGVRYPGEEPFWPEIFVYDFYQRSARIADRDRWEMHVRQNMESNIASVPIFSQWYLRIYRMNGGDSVLGSVLNRFLIVREQHFPRAAGDNTTFARTMNRGEFIHFWSGTTSANLTTSLATSVFGWTESLREMYQIAVANFSALTY